VIRDSFGIGLIVPSSNTVMEGDFHRHFQRPATVSTTRIFLEDVTPEGEVKMNRDELPPSLRLIKTVAPDVVVFGCTSAGSLGGIDYDAALGRTLSETTGASGVTVVASVVAELQSLKPQNVAVFTPYCDDLTRSVAGCIEEAGFRLAKTAGMGIVSNREIGRVTPEEIVQFAGDQFRGVDADCVFLSCTNWRAMEALEALRRLLGVPIVTSNQACVDRVAAMMESRARPEEQPA
jgi:maleate isomerase